LDLNFIFINLKITVEIYNETEYKLQKRVNKKARGLSPGFVVVRRNPVE
jgi:hypothetical protein